MRTEIAKRREEGPEHRANEQYFDLIHYEAIANKHWQSLSQDVFGFKELGNSKAKQLSWFERLNRIRNPLAHPERGRISKDNYDFLFLTKTRIEETIAKARLSCGVATGLVPAGPARNESYKAINGSQVEERGIADI